MVRLIELNRCGSYDMEPLLARIDFNSSKGNRSQAQQNIGWNYLSVPELYRLLHLRMDK